MPGALSAIAAILRQTPVILAAADALVARSRKPAITTADFEGMRKRLDEIEQHLQANASLTKDLADHATAMTQAVQASAAKAHQAFLLGLAGTVLGAIALVLTLLR